MIRKLRKRKQRLEEELRKAKRNCNTLKIITLTKELESIGNEILSISKKVTCATLADERMNRKERILFTQDIIAAIIACDILQKYMMNIRKHMLLFDDFHFPDIEKVENIIRNTGELVKIIDNISQAHPIIDENGNTYSLSDHYMNMVDEVETMFLGIENIISNVVNKTITIDNEDIQQFNQDCAP